MKFKLLILMPVLILIFERAFAHSLPDCQGEFLIQKSQVVFKFKASKEIVQLAAKQSANINNKDALDSLKKYILAHFFIKDPLNSHWDIKINAITETENVDPYIGKFQRLNVDLILKPSNPKSINNFECDCDLIIHQIPNQSIICSIMQDFENGIIIDNPKQIGVIALDLPTGKINPLKINIEKGNIWTGLKAKFSLGMNHIKEGIDHLLFLLVLLIPSMLLVKNKRWADFGGVKYSLLKLLKIVTAFTIGHSFTLLLGTLGWINVSSKGVEILIAISIIVSALHAIKPIFAGKEIFIAAGFGLIHGLAFASVLSTLALDFPTLVGSILSFNLGIEAMQIIIIICIIPLLLLLSQTKYYTTFRFISSLLSIIIALAWVIQRSTGNSNSITLFMDSLI